MRGRGLKMGTVMSLHSVENKQGGSWLAASQEKNLELDLRSPWL